MDAGAAVIKCGSLRDVTVTENVSSNSRMPSSVIGIVSVITVAVVGITMSLFAILWKSSPPVAAMFPVFNLQSKNKNYM